MNKKLVRMVAVLLTFALVLSAGCAGTQSNSGTGTNSTADSVQNSTANSTASTSKTETSKAASQADSIPEPDPGFQHDPRLADLGQVPIVKEPVTLNVVYSYADDIENNWAAKWLQEQTGLTFNWTLYPTDAFKERVAVDFSAGNKKDLVVSSNMSATKFTKTEEYKFAQQGLILPLDDYIANCSYNLAALIQKWPSIVTVSTAPDGHIYSIQSPSREGFGTYHGTASYKLWLNQEWMDRLGLQTPTTTEQFADVLRAFRDQDANGNGDPSDEIPLSTCIAGAYVEIDGFLMNAFLYNDPRAASNAPYIAVDDDGKVYSTVLRDEYRQGIEYLAGLCSEGLLYPDAFTQDRATQAALNCSGDATRIGALPAQHLGYLVTSFKESDRYQQYVALMPLTGPNGYVGTTNVHPSNSSNPNGFIPYTAENPEVAFRLLDFVSSDEAVLALLYGKKGVTWDDADAGALTPSGEPANFKTLTALDTNTLYTMTGWPQIASHPFYAGVSQDPKAENGEGQEYILWHATYEMEKYKTDYHHVYPTLYYSQEDSEAVALYQATINPYIVEMKAAFITGNRPMSEWNDFLSELDVMGMQDYLNLLQKNYDIYVSSTT